MKIKGYTREWKDGKVERGYTFWCPGCKQRHFFRTDNAGMCKEDGTPLPAWTFNGDLENPTFTPSLLIYADYEEGRKTLCHLFVTNGIIEYLSDCPHAMAGAKIPMIGLDQIGRDH